MALNMFALIVVAHGRARKFPMMMKMIGKTTMTNFD
jgi:hypothetical protein